MGEAKQNKAENKYAKRYPVGMLIQERSYTATVKVHRFGFNGMEQDDEVKGDGNSYTTQFRQYDTRLGRWFSIDPKASNWESPYVGMRNNPVFYTDILGDSVKTKFNDGLYEEAFKKFIGTKDGLKFVAQYAASGQTLYGYTFNSDGKYHTKGIDLTYSDRDLGAGGTNGVTEGAANGGKIVNGRLKLGVVINNNWLNSDILEIGKNKFVNNTPMNYEQSLHHSDKAGQTRALGYFYFSKVKTICHESFLHVLEYTKDFVDNRTIDYSTMPEYKQDMPSMNHHIYFHLGITANGTPVATIHPYSIKGRTILRQINTTHRLGLSEDTIWNNIWEFGD